MGWGLMIETVPLMNIAFINSNKSNIIIQSNCIRAVYDCNIIYTFKTLNDLKSNLNQKTKQTETSENNRNI